MERHQVMRNTELKLSGHSTLRAKDYFSFGRGLVTGRAAEEQRERKASLARSCTTPAVPFQ